MSAAAATVLGYVKAAQQQASQHWDKTCSVLSSGFFESTDARKGTKTALQLFVP